MSLLAAFMHVRSLQGAPSSRAVTSAVRSPELEARQHAESRGESERTMLTVSIAAIAAIARDRKCLQDPKCPLKRQVFLFAP